MSTNNNENDSRVQADCRGEPYVGQEFNDLESSYDFYNTYARNLGFGIRKNSSVVCKLTKELKWKNYVCDKAGLKGVSVDESDISKRRRDTRTGCKAKLGVRKSINGQWVITTFIKSHNHQLDTPRRTKKHRSHHISHKSKVVRAAMDELYEAGVRPCNIAKMLNIAEATNEISSQNVVDHLRVKRKNNIGREGVFVAEYLQGQLLKDSNFFFALELDTDGLLRSIFWADSRARNDYIMFGDVLVFDVTYKTNTFLMPFAPFTGVNHHRQSILFGCALLADETEESFVWLFQQWLRCMFGHEPKTVITDMDHAICSAVKIVFPNTQHRFCSWHINKHVVENLSEMRDSESQFSKDYWNWYNSKTISTSEETWTLLLDKYQLHNNKWLARMWERREHWVPTLEAHAGKCYTKSMFKLFQIEFKHGLECWHEKISTTDSIVTYLVGLSLEERDKWFNVYYDESNPTNTICECGKFEISGFLCKHVLHIMCKKRVTKLPDKYILKRWTIDARHILPYDARPTSETSTSQVVTPMMKWRLTALCSKLVEKLSTTESKFREFYESITSKLEENEECTQQIHSDNIGSQIDSNVLSSNFPAISIRDPILQRRKGRPRTASRISSGIEVSQENIKRRTCGSCGDKGHYATTCTNKSKGNMMQKDQ